MSFGHFAFPLSALPAEAKMAYAKNPFLPEALFRQLALDPNWGVRAQVARNPAIPQAVAYLLSEDRDRDVRKELASNPSIPPDVMRRLAEDPEFVVRLFLASNPALSTSLDAIEKLAGDPVRQIREAVASNPHLSGVAYRRIAELVDENSYLRLLVNPGVPHDTLADLYDKAPERTVISALRLTAVPLIVQLRLLEGRSSLVLSALAENPSLSPEAAKLLVAKEEMVRFCLAKNPQTPPEVLELLSKDENPLIREEANRTLLEYYKGKSGEGSLGGEN